MNQARYQRTPEHSRRHHLVCQKYVRLKLGGNPLPGIMDEELGYGGFKLSDIQRTIEECLAVSPSPPGPEQIYAQYSDGPDLRCTALFAVPSYAERQIIVKANSFKFLKGSVVAHCETSKAAPQSVCRVLGSAIFEQGSILLLQKFEAETLDGAGTPDKLCRSAEVLAGIQDSMNDFAQSLQNIEVVSVESVATLFLDCVAVVKTHFEIAWADDHDGKIAEAMGLPGEKVLDILAEAEPDLERWVNAILDIGLPLTVDHGDCHAGNIAQAIDGNLIIFDWENASISHPFFSVEKLLTSGWTLDKGAKGGPWGYHRESPTQNLIRARYLSAFSLSGRTATAAFNGAMCLAVIKEMAHEMEWARLCGWKDQNPEWTAQLIRRLLQHKTQFDTES